MTMRVVFACNGPECEAVADADGEEARRWLVLWDRSQAAEALPLQGMDLHFCSHRCLARFADQEMIRTVDERADEPGATQPGTKPLKRVGVFRASHGKHGNADEAHDAEVIHKGSLPAEERAE